MIRPCARTNRIYREFCRSSSPRSPTAKPTQRGFFSARGNGPQLASEEWPTDLNRTRNIGIIAHIDAGKTTTTERMLYYSGHTQRIGDVNEGSTVTDFLPAERARGITIQSAAITFYWPPFSSEQRSEETDTKDRQHKSLVPHAINLIDTPGHADFTFEVLRSLRVLDGAICILDGVAGVEAQTEKVWQQAGHYHIPIIVYINKLDREGAAFGKTVKEIGGRLLTWPAVCQIPWWDGGNGPFVGVGDVVMLRGLRWDLGGDGKTIRTFDLEELEQVDMKLAREIKRARVALVELLTDHDEELVEKFFDCGANHLAIPATDIVACLRRCLLNGTGKIVPVFAGASFRNIGVQPLLDAVVELLPSPTERPDSEIALGSERIQLKDLITSPASSKQGSRNKSLQAVPSATNLEACALAFKVVNDVRRGVLVYVRVYSGTLNRNAVVFNTNLQSSERAQRLLKMYASDAVEVSTIPTGQIGVIAGLQHARTGDTLISYTGMSRKTSPPPPLNKLQLRPIDIPPPVFFASIEPYSLSEEKHVKESLALLLREDPSLATSQAESGQTLLSGMGELHLEIARDRLVKDFKAKADMGSIEIAYRECLIGASEPEFCLHEMDVAGKKGKGGCEAQVQGKPVQALDQHTLDNDTNKTSRTVQRDGNIISIHIQGIGASGRPTDPSQTPLPPHLPLPVLHGCLINGALAGLVRGPNYGFPMHSTHVTINCIPSRDLFGSETTTAALTVAARRATHAALCQAARNSGRTSVMEPVMKAIISVDEASLGTVMNDINAARGGHILSLDNPSTDTATSDNDDMPEVIEKQKIYAPPDPFESGSNNASMDEQLPMTARSRTITAQVPLKEMVGYLKHLRSLTGGRGTFVMSFDRYEKMSTQRVQREKAVMEGQRGW